MSGDKWVSFFEATNRNLINQYLRSRYLIDEIIGNTPAAGRILEAGCGTALLSTLLADYGFRVTALDVNQDVLEYARRRFIRSGESLRFVQGDLFQLQDHFENERFDTVISQGVMEHFEDDQIVSILAKQREISDRVIFSVPNSLRRFRRGKPFGDERLMTNAKWTRLIKGAGFGSVRVVGGDVTKWAHVLPRILFERRFAFWRRFLSGQSIFICA